MVHKSRHYFDIKKMSFKINKNEHLKNYIRKTLSSYFNSIIICVFNLNNIHLYVENY